MIHKLRKILRPEARHIVATKVHLDVIFAKGRPDHRLSTQSYSSRPHDTIAGLRMRDGQRRRCGGVLPSKRCHVSHPCSTSFPRITRSVLQQTSLVLERRYSPTDRPLVLKISRSTCPEHQILLSHRRQPVNQQSVRERSDKLVFSIVILFEGWRKTLESESADALDVQLGKLICVRACRGLTREVEGDANEDIKT